MTEKKTPLILISNDDGYAAKGLQSLVDMVSDLAEIVVVAPDGGRSGASLSITSSEPVRVSLVEKRKGVSIYRCSGTPCDCVKIAFEKLLPRTPSVILSGINHGDNAAINVHYSGTMAVAIEGAMKRVPSIGFSSQKLEPDADLGAMAPHVRRIVQWVMQHGLPADVCLNVNFPALEVFEGLRLCRMGMGEWLNEWDGRIDPRGKDYYWLTGHFVGYDADDSSTDLWAIANGYIAITPIQLDLTAYGAMKDLEQLIQN